MCDLTLLISLEARLGTSLLLFSSVFLLFSLFSVNVGKPLLPTSPRESGFGPPQRPMRPASANNFNGVIYVPIADRDIRYVFLPLQTLRAMHTPWPLVALLLPLHSAMGC